MMKTQDVWLRQAGIVTIGDANRFLGERYIAEFKRKFMEKAAPPGTAFRKCRRRDLRVSGRGR